MKKDLFTTDENANGMSAFICRCNEEDAAEADELILFVREKLRVQGSYGTLSAVVYDLYHRFEAHICDISCDQWAMVVAEEYDGKGSGFQVAVQCDEVEDGVAAVWYGFYLRGLDLAGGAEKGSGSGSPGGDG